MSITIFAHDRRVHVRFLPVQPDDVPRPNPVVSCLLITSLIFRRIVIGPKFLESVADHVQVLQLGALSVLPFPTTPPITIHTHKWLI